MQFVEEFSNIDEIKNILENHSDLKVLFLDLVPSIANTLDKEYVLELLDNFINTSRSDLITVSNHLKT
jgi:hypothetical protein